MKYIASVRFLTPNFSILSPLINQVGFDQVERAGLFEVHISENSRLPFEKALHLVVDNVTNIDFQSWIAVTDTSGDGHLFYVDLASGVSTSIRRAKTG